MGNFFLGDLCFNWVFDRELINIGFGLTGHPSGMPFQKWPGYAIERFSNIQIFMSSKCIWTWIWTWIWKWIWTWILLEMDSTSIFHSHKHFNKCVTSLQVYLATYSLLCNILICLT